MEYFESVQQLLGKKRMNSELQERVKTITTWDNGKIIGIQDHYNGRYTFSQIAEQIGPDKFTSILLQFEKLLQAELVDVAKNIESELSEYNIVKGKSPDNFIQAHVHQGIQLSVMGKDWEGNDLDETSLNDSEVFWNGDIYSRGNRKHCEVELFRDRKFVRTVSTKEVRLYKLTTVE